MGSNILQKADDRTHTRIGVEPYGLKGTHEVIQGDIHLAQHLDIPPLLLTPPQEHRSDEKIGDKYKLTRGRKLKQDLRSKCIKEMKKLRTKQQNLLKRFCFKQGAIEEFSRRIFSVEDKIKEVEAEIALYEPLASVLRAQWAREKSFSHHHVEITAQQGRRSTGGRWTRPDLAVGHVLDPIDLASQQRRQADTRQVVRQRETTGLRQGRVQVHGLHQGVGVTRLTRLARQPDHQRQGSVGPSRDCQHRVSLPRQVKQLAFDR